MAITLPPPLNRLRASISFGNYPGLNITATLLGKRGISATFSGEATTLIPAMTTVIPSPEPYVQVAMTAHLVKTLPLANAFKNQMETLAYLGGCTLRPDTSAIQPWKFFNVSIQGVDGLDFSGNDADFTVRFGGFYYLNASLYNS